MKIERKISKKGSITLPSSLRRELGIEGNEKIEIDAHNNGNIIIKRIPGRCIFCGIDENVQAYHGRFVCQDCCKELGWLNDGNK